MQAERDVAIARAEGAERALAEASARAGFAEKQVLAIEAAPASPQPPLTWREKRAAKRKAVNG
ncbi:MAG: hypothetical protein HQ526_06225 [Actinobacteria bacterium]|nr:hypothetical protein [Actinomycetota bacterium]